MRTGPVVLALYSAASVVAGAGPQQPTFRSAVDVVVVEVHVVGSDGRPVADLLPSHFDVRIDGRRRQVMSAELLREHSSGAVTVPAGPEGARAVARNAWPAEGTLPGRTFVLAIDAPSLSAGDGAAVVRAARGFVDLLSSNDAVGLVTLPRGPSHRPTTDHVALRRALDDVVGLQAMRQNPFHLTPAEALDIASEMSQASLQRMAGGRGASLMTPLTLRSVQSRECLGAADQSCLQGIVIDADAQVRQIEDDLTESLGGLKRLLAGLADGAGRKTVVLLSGGMPVSDRSGGWHSDGSEARALGRASAMANATVYAVHVDAAYRAGQNSESRVMRPSVSIARDRELRQRLLADFAIASGGALLEAPIDAGEAALMRVLRETSAVYLLGVTPADRDLDGRPHELRVGLADRRYTVRSPRFVMLRPAS